MDEFGNISALNPKITEEIVDSVVSKMASDGLRTICVAYKDYVLSSNGDDGCESNAQPVPTKPDFEDEKIIVSELTCLGIFGIEDPVRPEVPQAIRRCQGAGVTVRMITGDNLNTARSIALKCGIIRPDDGSLVLEAKEFNALIRDRNGQVIIAVGWGVGVFQGTGVLMGFLVVFLRLTLFGSMMFGPSYVCLPDRLQRTNSLWLMGLLIVECPSTGKLSLSLEMGLTMHRL